MKTELKRLVVILCAVVMVVSFFRPNIYLILANFALAMFLYKKGWLSEAVRGREVSKPQCESEKPEQPAEINKKSE